MRKILISMAILTGLSITAFPQKAQLLHFYVEAGTYQRINTPVSVELEGVIKSDTLAFQLYEKVKGTQVEKPFQVEPGYVSRLWWILDGTTDPGKKREFFLYKNSLQKVQNAITTEITPDDIILKKGTSDILHYRKSVMYPPQRVDTAYKRSGFIHPMFSPSGNVLTRVKAPDHYHPIITIISEYGIHGQESGSATTLPISGTLTKNKAL